MAVKRLRVFVRNATWIIGCSMLAACANSKPPQLGAIAPQPITEAGQVPFSVAPSEYPLDFGDVINVNVFREDDLTASNLLVNAEGNISLPLVGTVSVRGKTPEALATDLRDRFKGRYLANPQVSVQVVKYGSYRLNVEGQVESPGIYEFVPGTRLSDAISLASGPKREARLSQVIVFRPTSSGLTLARFDLNMIRSGTMIDPVMMPKDRVVVGLSALSQFWQDMIKTLPALAIFTRL